MAKFLQGNELNLRLEQLIHQADKFLYIVSPYIKFHRRIKDALEDKRSKGDLEIVLLFGKNEDDKSRSVVKEEIEFLKSFPNIKIAHHNDLHAKFYATEDAALVTSLNLYDFSLNNNIEAGVELKPKSILKDFTSISNEDPYWDAVNYFVGVINKSKVLYEKEAIFETNFLGSKKYVSSKVLTDIVDMELGYGSNNKAYNTASQPREYQRRSSYKAYQTEKGYCIRTGVEIAFDPSRPMCYDAYQVWAQFSNMDYPENYCHKTGRKSNGNTSMRNPVL